MAHENEKKRKHVQGRVQNVVFVEEAEEVWIIFLVLTYVFDSMKKHAFLNMLFLTYFFNLFFSFEKACLKKHAFFNMLFNPFFSLTPCFYLNYTATLNCTIATLGKGQSKHSREGRRVQGASYKNLLPS